MLFACVAISWSENRSTRTAVVIARDVPVRKGPLDESNTSFTVHYGAEPRVLDNNNEWLQVTSDPPASAGSAVIRSSSPLKPKILLVLDLKPDILSSVRLIRRVRLVSPTF
jgi:hypothetical protein